MKTENPADPRLYRYLVVGNVCIIDGEGNVQAIPQNAMIVTEEPVLGLYQIGKAQQALQMTLTNKMGGEPAEVVDVILINFVLLGHMTNEEFNLQPEGVGIREREKPSAEILDFNRALDGKDG